MVSTSAFQAEGGGSNPLSRSKKGVIMLQDELERIEAEIADIYSLLFRGMTHEELFAKIIEEVLEEEDAPF